MISKPLKHLQLSLPAVSRPTLHELRASSTGVACQVRLAGNNATNKVVPAPARMALPTFRRVNEIVSRHPPSDVKTPSVDELSIKKPRTILFLSWMDANPRYIEKYTNLYSSIWPEAQIILVKTGVVDFFYRTESTARKLTAPVVNMLQDVKSDALHVHVMSNGGSKRWCTINKALVHSTGRSLTEARTFVDSAPGRSRMVQTWRALTAVLPRAFLPRVMLRVALAIVIGFIQLRKLLPGSDLIDRIRSQMNEREGVSAKSGRRYYIYSDEDQLIASEDVEDHAKDAEQNGIEVKLVKFHGSSHVGHYKHDPDRYRKTIESMWKE